MEKFIPARIAKQKAVDKIMDKPWKTLKGFPHLTHNFAHNLQQAILSHNKLYHKLHNNYYCCYIFMINEKESLIFFQFSGGDTKVAGENQ